MLLWLADPDRLTRYAEGLLTEPEADLLGESMQTALRTGTWSIADVALIDELATRVGPVRPAVEEERGFYEIEELDDFDGLRGDVRGAARP